MPTVRVIVLTCFLACSSARAQSIQIVSSTNDLHALAHATWTNTQDLQIMPPGVGSIRHSIGILAYDNAFEAAFLSQLTAVTNGGIARFPVQAIETNTTPRSRIWLNAAGTLVQTTDIPAGYDWMQVARSAYGQPPPWLSGSELDQWYADRAPDRIRVVAELISTSDVPAYLAMLTNSIGSGWDGTTNIPLLTLYSNDLAFVKIERTTGVVHAWVHAPASVSRIETYGSGNLLIPDGWTMISALNYATDPLYWSYPWADDLAILAAGNPAIDTDSDGLSDARELLLYGTLAEVGDTDGDGLSDGAEINTYGLNAKNADSDGDGMEDGWEVANGLNPLNAADAGQDADGDGIPNGIERIIGTNPQVADPVHDVAPGEVSLKYRSQKVQGEKVGFSPFNSGVWLPTEGCEPDGESAPWPPKKYQTYEKMSISESPDGHYYSESQESVGIEGGEARWALSFNGEVYTAIPQCPSNGQTETTTTFSGDFFRTNCGSRCGLTTEITVTKVCEGNYQTNSPAVYSNDWRDIAGETLRTGGSGCDGAYTFDRRTTTWVWENVITSAYSTTTLTYDGALSDEFTTGELVDWTQGASLTLPALQTLEWGNGTTLNLTCPPANGAETATAARRDLSTDELTLSLTRIQYAGALTNSTTGVVYRATMLHLFTPEGASTSAVVYVTNLWAKGTGGAVELWPTNGVTVEPPLAEGVISPNVLMVQLTALSMVLPSPQAALTLGYDRWFSAYEILPASFTADEAWIEIRGTNGVLVYKDDMIDKSGGTHGHNWHGTWNQGSMDGRYVNPSNSPYSVSVVTECYGVTSTSNIKAVDVEAQAFAGRRLFGWSDDHISGIAATLAELSYETEEDQSVSEASAIAAVPDRLVWYTLSHGLVDSNDVFKALDYGDEFFPGDVPTGVDYSLVFLNGCCSAQLGSGSNAEPFKDAFSADAYIGWKTTIHGSIAAGFASEFFAHLDGNKTISQAISDALATYTPGGFSHNQIVSSIRVIGDSDLIVDLSP